MRMPMPITMHSHAVQHPHPPRSSHPQMRRAAVLGVHPTPTAPSTDSAPPTSAAAPSWMDLLRALLDSVVNKEVRRLIFMDMRIHMHMYMRAIHVHMYTHARLHTLADPLAAATRHRDGLTLRAACGVHRRRRQCVPRGSAHPRPAPRPIGHYPM